MRYPALTRCPANQGVPNMRKIALLIAAFAAAILLQLCPVPAYATTFLSQTWVSHAGNDSNSCSQGSPCLTFAGALAKTLSGGEIDCLDSGNFGAVQITTSLTIDCSGTHATDFSIAGDGIDINAPSGIVVLRGIIINTGYYIGIKIAAAETVFIEDCTVSGSAPGILDQRSTGLTRLFIKNTVVRSGGNSPGPGIVLAAAPKNSVVLENVQSLANSYGVAVAAGNNVVISRSVMSGNTIAGIEADAGALVSVDNTEISHNFSYGIYAAGAVTLANSDISFNTSSIFGSTVSFGNNRLFGNGGGTAPTPAGGASTDLGQQ
jgi:hypothetical protein